MWKAIWQSFLCGLVVGAIFFAFVAVRADVPPGMHGYMFLGTVAAVWLAAWLLAVRDLVQAGRSAKNREANRVTPHQHPLAALIRQDENSAFRPVDLPKNGDLFRTDWYLNQTTFDFNRSIISLTLNARRTAPELVSDIRRVAHSSCGGNFLRTQILGVIVWGVTAELKPADLVSRHFAGRSGIHWVLLVDDTQRVVRACKYDHRLSTDAVYAKLQQWFSDEGYEVRGSLTRPLLPGSPLMMLVNYFLKRKDTHRAGDHSP